MIFSCDAFDSHEEVAENVATNVAADRLAEMKLKSRSVITSG
jgi:hypothetical protein